uniref:Uncharacterized protein n=1 Tax=Arundo donax TaxID=35708 RepID=A0A0A9BP22_ARUDO
MTQSASFLNSVHRSFRTKRLCCLRNLPWSGARSVRLF